MSKFWPEGRLQDTLENQQLISSQAGLEAAWRQQIPLEGLALRCDPAHNLTVRLGDTIGVIPREECALGIREGTTRDIAILTCVGKPVRVLITDFVDGIPQLSRRLAQEQALSHLLQRKSGDILPATVTHLEPYGAFVDIGCGVPSLIPLKAISVSRIPHPNCRFSVGQSLYAVVRQVLPEQGRVVLSHKELLGTWSENACQFQAGETVTGIVRSVMDYGIFVELSPNLTGLAEPLDGYQAGDSVAVYLKSILPDRQKIKLAIIGPVAPVAPSPLVYHATAGRVVDWDYHGRTTRFLPESDERSSVPLIRCQ